MMPLKDFVEKTLSEVRKGSGEEEVRVVFDLEVGDGTRVFGEEKRELILVEKAAIHFEVAKGGQKERF